MNEVLFQSEPKTKWWNELAWQLYELLPAAADELLKRRYRYLLLFKNLRIPIGILRGTIRSLDDTGTLVFAGDKSRLDYLIQYYFDSIDRQEILGAAPPGNLAKILKSLRSYADLTIALVDRFSAGLFFKDDYLTVPELVGSALNIPTDLAELTRGNSSLKSDLRVESLSLHVDARTAPPLSHFYVRLAVGDKQPATNAPDRFDCRRRF